MVKPCFIKLTTEYDEKILINISSIRYKNILENEHKDILEDGPLFIKLTTEDGETKIVNIFNIRFVGESTFENCDLRFIVFLDSYTYVKETIDEIENLIKNVEGWLK